MRSKWSLPLGCLALLTSHLTGQQHPRKCGPYDQPKRLPTIGQIADTSTLAGRLASLPGSGEVALSLQVGEGGDVLALFPVEGGDPARGSALKEAVAGSLHDPLPRGPWAIRLGLDSVATVFLARSVYCPPVVRDDVPGAGEPKYFEFSRSGGGRAASTSNATPSFLVTVDSTGQVTAVRVLSGKVGGDPLQTWAAVPFFPALLDGRRVTGTYRSKRSR